MLYWEPKCSQSLKKQQRYSSNNLQEQNTGDLKWQGHINWMQTINVLIRPKLFYGKDTGQQIYVYTAVD